MRKDTTKHPFEIRFREMVKKAKLAEKTRAEKVRVKPIPSHIVIVEEEGRYGMFNTRLAKWVCEEYSDYHQTFRTPEAATQWYRSLI